MSLMDAMQATSASLIQSQGQPVTLTAPGGTYAAGVWTGNGVGVQTQGVLLPLSRGLTHMPGTDIQSGDQQLLLPGTIALPVVDTKAVIGGKTYTIVEVKQNNPAGTPIFYDCIVRSGQ